MSQIKLPALAQVLQRLVLLRLFLPLVALSVVAIGGVGYLGEQTLESQQHQKAQFMARIVDHYLDQATRTLDAVARVAEVSPPEDLPTFMQGAWEAYGYFDTLYYLDASGKITLLAPPNPRYLGLDLSNLPYFRQTGEEKNLVISRPFISLRTGNPTVYLIRPLSQKGQVVGELNLGSLQDEITYGGDVPGQGMIFIMDQSGMLLAHPYSDLVKQQTNQSNLEIFRRGLGGGTTLVYEYAGTMVLGSTARVERTGWVVVDQVPLSAALSPYTWALGLTLLASLVIWLALTWNLRGQLRRHVVTPLVQLSRGTGALANGDFSQGKVLASIPAAFAELTTLATDFQYMSDALEARQVALQESEERYRLVFENSPVSIWEEDFSGVKALFDDLKKEGVTDLETYFTQHPETVQQCADLTKIVDVNQAALTLHGAATKEELLAGLVNTFTPESFDTFRHELVHLWNGEMEMITDAIVKTLAGELRNVTVYFSVCPGCEETLSKTLVSLIDISERKQAEEELKTHRDHLEELVRERTAELIVAKDAAEEARRLAEAASRAKSAFLAQMSHELRTPLNAILGYTQILQRRPLDSDVIAALNTVQRSGEHLLTLINDVLDIARIEAGRLELFPTPIHFPGFLDHVASIIRARAEAKGLTFAFEKLGAIPVGVQADETRLRQVLLNLLDNAVKFTDAGHVTLRVKQISDKQRVLPQPKVALSQQEGTETVRPFTESPTCLRFEVEDTGIGIPSDQVERIFQPFEQVGHATRWTSGTGLGLAISHQLVRLMGGDLQVESEVDRGSTFWFEIVLPVTEMAMEAVQPPERAITGYRGPRRTVLVVDDVPSNRAILVDLLQPLGFEVVEAVDGQQAIHLAQELRPDLILMDRWMPVLDGLEAAQRMRQIPELREAPIVTVSASVSNEDQEQSQEVGIDAFLPKPVSWPRLAALLQECLALEWEYEEQRSGGAEEQERRLSPAPLVPPSEEEMEILLDLARRGDMRAIRERTAHIETLGEQYVPFARRLRELAKSFEERRIRTLIEQYVEKDQ